MAENGMAENAGDFRIERWEQEFREELDKHGPGYNLDITEVNGDTATAILRNRHDAYYLFTGNVNKSGAKAEGIGTWDSLKREEGGYCGMRETFGVITRVDIIDPKGEILDTKVPPPWETYSAFRRALGPA